MSASELFLFINGEFRQALDRTRDELDATLLLGNTLSTLDRAFFGLYDSENTENPNRTPMYFTLENILLNQRKEVKGTVWHDPHSFSASIGYDEHREEVLILAHHQNKEYNDCLKGTLGLKDWHYQNQSDKPDDISEEEWAEREKSWGRVMPSWLPMKTMLSFNLRHEDFWHIDLKNIAEQVETAAENDSTALPSDAVENVWNEMKRPENRAYTLTQSLLTQSIVASQGIEWYLSYARWSAINRASKELSAHMVPLIPEYTLEDMTRSETWDKKVSSDSKARVYSLLDDTTARVVEESEA